MTDQIAFIASTAYFFDGDHGEAVIGKSRDGRRIAIYLDDATGSYWVCRLKSWERYADGDLDYSLWCSTSEAYELEQDCEGTFFGDIAPAMSPRDNWGLILESAARKLWRMTFFGEPGKFDRALLDRFNRVKARLAQVRS